MNGPDRWLLPDGVDEILPPQAGRLETLRREILDLYASWGYELVIPPLVEFLDSLLIVPGNNELNLRTFKIVDQLSGRSMGVRADITSQVARIDAHGLKGNIPVRLCYADSVLHTRPQSLLGSRVPILIGAELYGHSGVDSDIEVITLMLETLAIAGIEDVQLALGHVGIYRTLVAHAELEPQLEQKLFDALQRKATEEITQLLEHQDIDPALLLMLKNLVDLCGGDEVLDKAAIMFNKAPEQVSECLGQLQAISRGIRQRFPQQSLYYDLAELHGYQYHSGLVFAAYAGEHGDAIANGGRYDAIGKAFGRARPATGFDADLTVLMRLSTRKFQAVDRIFAPYADNDSLLQFINQLRSEGHVVIAGLQGQTESAADMHCSHEITMSESGWQLRPVKN